MKKFEDLFEELSKDVKSNPEILNSWKIAKEKEKKTKKRATIILLVIFIIEIIIILKTEIYKITVFMPLIFFTMSINLMIYVIMLTFSNNKEYVKYYKLFKKTIINKLINNFYDNVEYFPNKPIPERIYKELNYEPYDRYKSEDYIEARIDNKYDISMAEVRTIEIKTEEDSDGKTHTTTTTRFSGLFAKIVIDKSINSELQIGTKSSYNTKRLEMDSEEFEKYFKVYTTNEIIGMQILTADIMEDLIEFIKKTNMTFDISIKNNNIYLRFDSGEMFEPEELKNGILNKPQIKKYFYMLNFTYNLSNKIIKVIDETEI